MRPAIAAALYTVLDHAADAVMRRAFLKRLPDVLAHIVPTVVEIKRERSKYHLLQAQRLLEQIGAVEKMADALELAPKPTAEVTFRVPDDVPDDDEFAPAPFGKNWRHPADAIIATVQVLVPKVACVNCEALSYAQAAGRTDVTPLDGWDVAPGGGYVRRCAEHREDRIDVITGTGWNPGDPTDVEPCMHGLTVDEPCAQCEKMKDRELELLKAKELAT